MAKKVTKTVTKKVAAKKEVSIPALLKELAACEDQLEKRKIRAKLRKAGHTGGVSATTKAAKATKAKAVKGKKAKTKKTKVVEDDE